MSQHMEQERWEKVQDLFHEAAELPEKDRRPFLDANCFSDPSLLSEVLALLDADSKPASVLGKDVSEIASALISS